VVIVVVVVVVVVVVEMICLKGEGGWEGGEKRGVLYLTTITNLGILLLPIWVIDGPPPLSPALDPHQYEERGGGNKIIVMSDPSLLLPPSGVQFLSLPIPLLVIMTTTTYSS